MDRLELFSPAKVNLFFRVLRKRDDGYHDIVSLAHTVNLFDRLVLKIEAQDRLECSDPVIPTDRSNLAFCALDLFRQKTGWKGSVHIQMMKQIPSQAGLGGGSSNAATVLWGLNQLTQMGVDEAQLQKWSAALGADVPLFFSKGTALCQKRGEEVEDLPPLSLPPFLLIKPSEGLSTPDVYRQYASIAQEGGVDPMQLVTQALLGNIQPCNDLERAAFTLLPSLKQLKEQLHALGCKHVMMTGSGTGMLVFDNDLFTKKGCIEMMLGGDVHSHLVECVRRQEGQWYAQSSLR